MAPSPSPEALAHNEIDLLLDLAEAAIHDGLTGRRRQPPDLVELPPALHHPIGAFVTLEVAGDLNGCIGTLEGGEALGHAVPRLAVSAAFADHRLPALTPRDLPHLTIELSLLTPLRPLGAASWIEVVEMIRPGVDGVAIGTGHNRALFLPGVWGQLPDPVDFLDHLYRKAGLAPRSWPAGMEVHVFGTRSHQRAATPIG